MDRFAAVSGSPMADTPICDSDEEVFFGPVTTKELSKASQLKRRTQFYFPSFDWKPSTSVNNAVEKKESDSKTASTEAIDQANLSLSADSLETQSFLTLSDRPEDSSKGEYCSALSGNSSNSQTSLNDANFYSKFSEDSLDSDRPVGIDNTVSEVKLKTDARTPRKASSLYSNMSEDSLENTEHAMNAARLHSVLSGNTWNNSEDLSEEAQMCNENIERKNVFNMNETHSGSESGFNNDSLLSTPKVGANGQLLRAGCLGTKSNQAFTSTYEVLPEMEDNETYTIDDDSCEVVEPGVPTNINLSEEVPVDKDGGFLSILSEAALYHASQLKDNENGRLGGVEESTQSLEDRFKTFGIGANDLEEQQLSSSIMYVTGRESNILSSETESNTFYTGVNSGAGSSFSSEEQYNQKSTESLAESSASSSYRYEQESTECGDRCVVNVTSGSEGATSNKMEYSNVLNQPISNSTLGSAGRTFQSSHHEDVSIHEVHPDSGTESEGMEQTGSYLKESSGISGVCRLDSVSENQSNSSIQSCNDEDVSNNVSDDSSYAGEMNDTLEEYEMMMRYGVEYILGRKGNKKKGGDAEWDEESSKVSQSPHRQNASPLHHALASPRTHQQNSSGSSAEYLDAVDVSAGQKQGASSRTKDCTGISPLQKQLFKCTPQKIVKDIQVASTKGISRKLPSKLPRVASMTPSKLTHKTSPHTPKQYVRPITSSSESKVTSKFRRPVTPSSEPKVGLFKKPVTPVAGGSRIPKTFVPHHATKPNTKILENIQSPVGAYIHNSPSPVLVTNVKGKCSDRSGFDKEMHARALWRAGELKSSLPKPVSNMENINPNIGCGLPSVKYTKAPCVKLDEATRLPVPKGGEKINKLMDAPSPQVIKHEGRVRVNCGSPQLAARMHSMADTFDESMIDAHSVSGDISVCVSQQACRTYTLGQH